jgi:energy-coupling factor transporter ATP-binding protein EcfA2
MMTIPTMILALTTCGAWQESKQPAPVTQEIMPEVGLIETPPPDTLPVYAHYTIKLRPKIEIVGRTIDLGNDGDRLTISTLWTRSDSKALKPETHEWQANFDSRTLTIRESVRGGLLPGPYKMQVTIREGASGSRRDGEPPRLIVASKPVPIEVTTKYTVDVTPQSAARSAEVEIRITPRPYPYALSTARVYFGSTPSLVVGPTESGLRVLVPDAVSSGHQNVRVELGDPNVTVVKNDFTGFTVQRSWIEVLTLLFLPVFLGLLALSGWANYRLFTQLRDYQAQITRLQDASKGRIAGSTPKSLQEDLLPLDSKAGTVPKVPRELALACTGKKCVLFAGGGVAIHSGLPSFGEALKKLIEDASKEDRKHSWDQLQLALESGDENSVANVLRTWLSPNTLIDLLRRAYVRGPKISNEIYRLLSQIPFAGVLNWTWDERLRTEVVAKIPRGTDDPQPRFLTSSDRDEFVALLRDMAIFQVDLNGRLDDSTLVFTPEEFRNRIAINDSFSKFVDDCYTNRTLFFVGTSPESIEQFLSGLNVRVPTRGQVVRHFALVPRLDNAASDFSFREELFRSKYGIELIGYIPTRGHPQVPKFLASLPRKEPKDQSLLSTDKPKDQSVGEGSRTPRLDRITLRNIGPFDNLDLDLHEKKAKDRPTGDPVWNVVLGNNGCGKSTLLRAIALGLCGDAPAAQESGARLLKAGADEGMIILEIGGQKRETTLTREKLSRLVVVGSGVTPLQVGRWVALGFPALRGASRDDPAGPGPQGGAVSAVRDVLPLLRGVVDWRLDDLKQWIVNLEAEMKDSTAEEDAARAKGLLTAFFDVFREFVPGAKCKFARVEKSTEKYTVLVETDDGKIPLDQLSQGTGSILCWVGTLLKRLYEIYPMSKSPETERALVLIDEIDAHMHPDWQQLLVPVLRQKFRGLQVIATTHSPLIVLNMERGEIIRLKREGRQPALKTKLDKGAAPEGPGRIEAEVITESLKGQTAAQALTGPLGLLSSRDVETASDYIRYTELAAKANRSEADVEELDRISKDLNVNLPSGLETAEARKARELIKRMYHDELAQRSQNADRAAAMPLDEQRLLDEATVQLLEITSGSRRPK